MGVRGVVLLGTLAIVGLEGSKVPLRKNVTHRSHPSNRIDNLGFRHDVQKKQIQPEQVEGGMGMAVPGSTNLTHSMTRRQARCPVGWSRDRAMCYRAMPGQVEFAMCASRCAPGAPVCIQDSQSNRFVRGLSAANGWVGYVRSDCAQNWRWVAPGCRSTFVDWRLQPNDCDKHCTEMQTSGSWASVACANQSDLRQCLCSMPASDPPTGVPTIASFGPTQAPTSTPTLTPTTRRPTRIRTSSPTVHPTRLPTATPTAFPSRRPTAVPTDLPSAAPTFTPSTAPSANPTAAPTSVPTAQCFGVADPTECTSPIRVNCSSQNASRCPGHCSIHCIRERSESGTGPVGRIRLFAIVIGVVVLLGGVGLRYRSKKSRHRQADAVMLSPMYDMVEAPQTLADAFHETALRPATESNVYARFLARGEVADPDEPYDTVEHDSTIVEDNTPFSHDRGSTGGESTPTKDSPAPKEVPDAAQPYTVAPRDGLSYIIYMNPAQAVSPHQPMIAAVQDGVKYAIPFVSDGLVLPDSGHLEHSKGGGHPGVPQSHESIVVPHTPPSSRSGAMPSRSPSRDFSHVSAIQNGVVFTIPTDTAFEVTPPSTEADSDAYLDVDGILVTSHV